PSGTGCMAIGGFTPALSRAKTESFGALTAGPFTAGPLGMCLRARFLHGMSAELIAERGEQPLAERVAVARAKAREERGRQDRERHRPGDGLVERPSAFARILHGGFEPLA